MHSQPNGFKIGVKLPPVEGISAKVSIGTIPTVDELLKLRGKMPLIMAYGLPAPIVGIKIMVGITPFDEHEGVPLSTVNFLANIDLLDTQEIEDTMDDLLIERPEDGPQLQSDSDSNIRLQILKSDNSIILASDTAIDLGDTKLPKKALCAFTSKVFATSLTILRNHDRMTKDPKNLESISLGEFELSISGTGKDSFYLGDL